MRRRLTTSDITSALVLVIILITGTTAYATHPGGADTISTVDIINSEVKSVDLAAGGVQAGDIAPNSIDTARLEDAGILGVDIAGSTVNTVDLAPNAVVSGRVANDSLTGIDIQEATLAGVDAEELDGKDSGELVQGKGRILTNRTTAAPNQTVYALNVPGFFEIFLACAAGGPGLNNLAYRSASSEALRVYFDGGGADPTVQPIAGGDTTTFSNGVGPGPDRHIVQVSSATGKLLTAVVTSEVFSPTLCDVAADGVYTEP